MRLSRTGDAHRLLVMGAFVAFLWACGSSSAGTGPDAAIGAIDSATGDDAAAEIEADGGSQSGTDASTRADAGPVDSGNVTADAPADAPAKAPADGSASMFVYVTFYGWADNSPPGGAIAYPMSDGHPTLHETAGGTGTYADPITFATDKAEFPVGTRLYVPFIEKYVMMEDDCVECDSDWTSAHKWHIDLWMNSDDSENPSALASCEDRWTRDSTSVEIDPPDGRTVTTTPLFTPATNTCRTTP
jgi:3D (Asp-Asp-Asp) domain-containing protein